MTKQWKYSQALADEICLRLVDGESIRTICNDKKMPSRATVLRWCAEDKEFEAKCVRAREWQADVIHDDMSDIEADVLSGKIDPQAARVVLSSKQWRASKLAPKKYGEKVTQEIIGDANNPIAFKDGNPREFIASRIAGLSVILRPSEDTGGTDGDAG